jgi:hypothetical protein
MAAVANGHRRNLCGRFLCRNWRRRRPGIGREAEESRIEIARENGTMSKSKMIGERPSFRITTNLLSPREKGGDWNACCGTHGHQKIIAIRDREKNVGDRLNALGVNRMDVVMDVSGNRNESLDEKRERTMAAK